MSSLAFSEEEQRLFLTDVFEANTHFGLKLKSFISVLGIPSLKENLDERDDVACF